MLQAWHITLKKLKITIISLVGLLSVFLLTSGFVQPNVTDNAHILEKKTTELIEAKNNRYLQTKEQPQIAVITVKRLNHLTPNNLSSSKKTAYIVVGKKGKKKNVQIYSSKDLHAAFNAESRLNIIRAVAPQLRSNNKAKFNKGLRFVFKACATRIDQQYQYSLDKYDLTNAQQDKISHPHRVALPIALGIVILVGALYYLFKNTRRRTQGGK